MAEPATADTYPMPPDGWVCFHCGERFTTPGAAADHFGETPEAEPGCVMAVRLGRERGFIKALRKAENRARRLAERVEALESYARVATADWQRITGLRTAYDIRCEMDALEGRALAAEAIVADIATRWPALVEASRRRICSAPRPAAPADREKIHG